MLRQQSPFLNPGAVTKANTLAIIQLSKDDFTPVYLRHSEGEHDGYKEGHVLNTRFGSFPHSTLIGVPWGSQVRASKVDTGSRGRRNKKAPSQPAGEGSEANGTSQEAADESGTLKRKRDANDEGEKRAKTAPHEPISLVEAAPGSTAAEQPEKAAAAEGEGVEVARETEPSTETTVTANEKKQKSNPTVANTGFVHILPPTPEIWTSSLPHRTQVVYTPDYSYILQRIRARPGTRLIEAGSGSGSFTHAAARAVYSGVPRQPSAQATMGKVFSFEFHEQRFEKMTKELGEHGLRPVVDNFHRDVYNDGFLVNGQSPEADAVFLDLPAPWLALPHLSRRKPKTGSEMDGIEGSNGEKWISPLNPRRSVHICTFSPCIEQVTRTVSEMRRLGWVEIEMVEIAYKRIQVYREKIGLHVVSERGTQQAPKDVAEALEKLKEIDAKATEHNAKMLASHGKKKRDDCDDDLATPPVPANETENEAQEEIGDMAAKSYMQGQLITRPEAEIKAHTSYLVFAVLPQEWTEEDEAAAAAKWPIGQEKQVIGVTDRAARKQAKREMLQSKGKKARKAKQQSKAEAAAVANAEAGQDKDVPMQDAQAE